MWMPEISGPIAVIDVETTGLFPNRQDRIVEIATVVLSVKGQIEREFVSLVNPDRDLGPTSIHGLSAADVIQAPRFQDVAGELLETIRDCVAIAGHNVRFDSHFLNSEFSRIGNPLPDYPTLCTMQLAGGGKLWDCCQYHAIKPDGPPHSAIVDARGASQLLVALLSDDPQTVSKVAHYRSVNWPVLPISGIRPLTRDQSRTLQSAPSSYLQRLLHKRGEQCFESADLGAILAYGALLDRVLEDRRIDDCETDALLEVAQRWGIGISQIQIAHRDYLNQLIITALADGVVTEAERKDLLVVAKLLGQNIVDLDESIQSAVALLASTKPKGCQPSVDSNLLVGKRVCFTGELQCLYNRMPITREKAEELASDAGLIVCSSVTKKLDVLVIADPYSQSGKAKKARECGIRIMHEPVFWNTIGVAIS